MLTFVWGSSAGLGRLQLVEEQHSTFLMAASRLLAYDFSSTHVLELRGM
jgi:hypothetical protein